MRRVFFVMLGMLLFGSVASAMRTRRPPTLTDLTDRNQLVELNNYLSEVYELTNGRYTLENLDIDPQDVRKGTKGDLVYATFSSIDHLCINTSFPAAKDWTCVNVETLSTCPGGDNQQVQYNDNGTCRGELAFIYNEDSNSVGIGEDVITPSASLEIDPADVTTTVSGILVALKSSPYTMTIGTSGETLTSLLANQFLAPTINGIAGAPTETVSNASTVYISGAPSGSNVSLNAADLMFGSVTAAGGNLTAFIATEEESATNASGRAIAIYSGDGRGTGAGGDIELQAGDSGSGTVGDNGGHVIIFAGDNGGGNYGGEIAIISGDGQSGANNPGGWLLLEAGGAAGTQEPGVIRLRNGTTSSTGMPSTDLQAILFDWSGNWTVSSGVTAELWTNVTIEGPQYLGIAGGATETLTDAATLFITSPPTGTNVTLTTAADIMFSEMFASTNDALIKVQDELTANTAGRDLTIESADGLGTGAGGDIDINAGNGGATGNGGTIGITASNGGSTDSNGGNVDITAGDGTGTNSSGGDITLRAGESVGSSSSGSVIVARGNQTGIVAGTSFRAVLTNDILADALADGETLADYSVMLPTYSLLRGVAGGGTETFSNASTVFIDGAPKQDTNAVVANTAALRVDHQSTAHALSDGQTRAFQAEVQFYAPPINGIAGGSTETVTSAATLYIDAAPSGSNITFTNGPYALWSDSGTNRFDGYVEMFASATVTGILNVDGATTTNNTITSSRTSDIGWSVQTGANTACNTTCTFACVFGQDTDTANGPIVGCADATADRCTCAGVN